MKFRASKGEGKHSGILTCIVFLIDSCIWGQSRSQSCFSTSNTGVLA